MTTNKSYETNLTIGDSVHGMIITKMTDKSCWLDNKRYAWDSVTKMINNETTVQTKFNSNRAVDWTSKDAVNAYYNSFKAWGFYIANGDVTKANLLLVEVKEGLVLLNGEYYLPAPSGTHNNPNQKGVVADGSYYVHVMKKYNTWFGNQSKHQSNLFCVRNAVNVSPTLSDISKLKANTTEIYCYPYGGDFNVNYSQSRRSGLTIDNIYIRDFNSFFKKTYCSDRWGYNTDFIMLSDEILNRITANGLVEQLDEVLNSSSYDIDDDESYGEYTLKNIQISKKDCERFFKLIEDRLKRFGSSEK